MHTVVLIILTVVLPSFLFLVLMSRSSSAFAVRHNAASPPRPVDPRPRLLMVADDSPERLREIEKALESTGLFATVSWTRDLHLIPKYYESYIHCPKSVLAANCDKFDIALVDHRASDRYEWSWSPRDVFYKFSPPSGRYATATSGDFNGNALRVGMGPTARHAYLTEQGAQMNVTYAELVGNRCASSATFPELLVDVKSTAQRMVAMWNEIKPEVLPVPANNPPFVLIQG